MYSRAYNFDLLYLTVTLCPLGALCRRVTHSTLRFDYRDANSKDDIPSVCDIIMSSCRLGQ